MTDAQWAVVEPLLPPPGSITGRGGRPEKHPRRVILDAIFYVVRGGIAWRQLPVDFPPAMTVYDLFRRWARTGVRTFGWISKHRRCVRAYETLPEHHEAMVTIAMIMTMSRRLARTGDW